MLANFPPTGKAASISKKSITAATATNPYRAILRRDYPEPLIALLAFILGIWLWDHHFGATGGYEPGTEEIALLKIDRDLRLADAMAEDPAWLRWMAGVDEPAVVKRRALITLNELSAGNAIGLSGIEAFAIIRAEKESAPILQSLAETIGGGLTLDYQKTAIDLATHQGTWWHAKLAATLEQTTAPVHWRKTFDAESLTLRTRALFAGSAVWLLGLAGLAFVPSSLRRLRGGLLAKPRLYGGAWPVPLGLVVFLMATLAWIGFVLALELGISSLPGMSPALGIFIDSAARLLPAAIAVGLLFRRPSHAARVLGLTKPLYPGTILGIFSLLIIADQILRALTGHLVSSDPGGGLSAGDAGPWGLAFAIISACVVAPFAEEILYRGVLFRSFWNRLGVLPAAVLSSVVFAILHFYDGYGLASVAVFGFSCALFYASTGSLVAIVALHMLYNLSIKLPEWIVYHAPLG